MVVIYCNQRRMLTENSARAGPVFFEPVSIYCYRTFPHSSFQSECR